MNTIVVNISVWPLAFAIILASIIMGPAKKVLQKQLKNWILSVQEFLGSIQNANGEYRLDWTMREVLRLFSNNLSNRWYEAYRHTGSGFWLSLACTIRIVQIVQFSYGNDSFGNSVIAYYWLTSKKKLKQIINDYDHAENIKEVTESFIVNPKYKEEVDCDEHGRPSVYLTSIFIAGENVIYDWICGTHRDWQK